MTEPPPPTAESPRDDPPGKTYTVSDGELVLTLERDEEDPKWFVVTTPLIPRLCTQARSLDEAFEMGRDWIRTMQPIDDDELDSLLQRLHERLDAAEGITPPKPAEARPSPSRSVTPAVS